MVRFFFSSRRRHTRLVSDWSSDVCSSDLDGRRLGQDVEDGKTVFLVQRHEEAGHDRKVKGHVALVAGAEIGDGRSEERRVGKKGELGCRRMHRRNYVERQPWQAFVGETAE